MSVALSMFLQQFTYFLDADWCLKLLNDTRINSVVCSFYENVLHVVIISRSFVLFCEFYLA